MKKPNKRDWDFYDKLRSLTASDFRAIMLVFYMEGRIRTPDILEAAKVAKEIFVEDL